MAENVTFTKVIYNLIQLFVHCRCNVISCYFYCYKYFQFFCLTGFLF